MKKVRMQFSKEPHCHDLESLGSIFLPLIKTVIKAEDLVEVDIILKWQDIVGKEMAMFCHPVKTRYNPKDNCRTLSVEVPVGGFALEIQHKQRYILDKINAYFGYQAVHKINVSQNANIKINKTEQGLCRKKSRELSEDEKKYLAELSETIKDDNLREILIKLGENILQNKKE
ncbi:MAG: DUF721 domain-containing protein [Alphaproteobacteria bacterium]|nr:DUF721 domain-containing protein [Alphaproteobacteria bacterium]